MNRWTINEREKRKTQGKLKLRSDVFLEKMARLTFSIILEQSGRSSREAWIINSSEVINKESVKGTA